jgi:hypothetical protein
MENREKTIRIGNTDLPEVGSETEVPHNKHRNPNKGRQYANRKEPGKVYLTLNPEYYVKIGNHYSGMLCYLPKKCSKLG